MYITVATFILLRKSQRQARERISSTVKGIIKERRSAGSWNKQGDFLDVLLSSNELSDEEKVSFVLDSLLGGYETTSLLISMVVYFLGQSAQDLDLVKVTIVMIIMFNNNITVKAQHSTGTSFFFCAGLASSINYKLSMNMQREHDSIRSNKGKEECLTSEDYKKMEYTQQVR